MNDRGGSATRWLIGIDLDNTLVCYDVLFHAVALEEGLIEPTAPKSKERFSAAALTHPPRDIYLPIGLLIGGVLAMCVWGILYVHLSLIALAIVRSVSGLCRLPPY